MRASDAGEVRLLDLIYVEARGAVAHGLQRFLQRRRIALEEKIVCHQGVFVAVAGPNLETRAEYRMLRAIGADVIGMSTVPEVIVGVHAGLRILGISIVTDLCTPDTLHPVKIDEIIAVAQAAEPRIARLLRGFIRSATI